MGDKHTLAENVEKPRFLWLYSFLLKDKSLKTGMFTSTVDFLKGDTATQAEQVVFLIQGNRREYRKVRRYCFRLIHPSIILKVAKELHEAGCNVGPGNNGSESSTESSGGSGGSGSDEGGNNQK